MMFLWTVLNSDPNTLTGNQISRARLFDTNDFVRDVRFSNASYTKMLPVFAQKCQKFLQGF